MDLQGKKVLFLGDSITYGSRASAPEFRYVDRFGAKTGATVKNYGIGGTRIAPVHHSLSAKPEWDQTFLSRVDEMDADADAVVVFGGTNDFGHGDGVIGSFNDTDEYTFYGALHALVKKLMTKYPAARLVFLTPLHRTSELVTVNEVGLPTPPLVEYVKAIREIADYYSIPVLDLWSISGIFPRDEQNYKLYTSDGLHPNDLGMERIAHLLCQFFRNVL